MNDDVIHFFILVVRTGIFWGGGVILVYFEKQMSKRDADYTGGVTLVRLAIGHRPSSRPMKVGQNIFATPLTVAPRRWDP